MKKKKKMQIQQQRERRKKRVRTKVRGGNQRVRLSVFRSNRCIYAQIIDDIERHTLCAMSDANLGEKLKKGKTKTEIAFEIGQALAEKALETNIREAVFDRGPYRYHGRVKALAEGARKGGLKI